MKMAPSNNVHRNLHLDLLHMSFRLVSALLIPFALTCAGCDNGPSAQKETDDSIPSYLSSFRTSSPGTRSLQSLSETEFESLTLELEKLSLGLTRDEVIDQLYLSDPTASYTARSIPHGESSFEIEQEALFYKQESGDCLRLTCLAGNLVAVELFASKSQAPAALRYFLGRVAPAWPDSEWESWLAERAALDAMSWEKQIQDDFDLVTVNLGDSVNLDTTILRRHIPVDPDFLSAQSLVIRYGRGEHGDDSTNLAREAAYLLDDEETVVATAEGGQFIDEDDQHLIQVTYKLFHAGQTIATLVAKFQPTGREAHVVSTVLDERWESRYSYDNEDTSRTTIPRVETYDLSTGEKVAETKDVRRLERDRFYSVQCTFSGGELVYQHSVIRDSRTGLPVDVLELRRFKKWLDHKSDKNVRKDKWGYPSSEFHQYELVLMGWPEELR